MVCKGDGDYCTGDDEGVTAICKDTYNCYKAVSSGIIADSHHGTLKE